MPSSPSQNPDEQPGLLKILASVFSGVLFGLFLSKFDTPTKNDGEPIHPKDNPRPETTLGSLQVPATPQVPPTPTQHYYPDRRKDSTPRWKKWTEIVAVCIAGGLLIANAFVTVGTWKAAKAARDAARIADATLKANSISAWRDQRAWIVASANHTVQFEGPNAIEIFLDNLGKTEAKNLDGFVGIKIVKKGEVPDLAEKTWKAHIKINVLVPRFHKPVRIPAMKESPEGRPQQILTSEIANGLRDGSVSMLVYGTLNYIDAWKTLHWIKFCDSIGAYNQTPPNPCGDYNGTDENEPK